MVFRNVQNVPKNVEKYFARKERYLTFYQVGNSFGVGIQIARFLIQLRYSTQNCPRVGWRSNEKAYKATDKMIMTYTLLQIIPLLDFYFTVKSIQIKWIDSSFYIYFVKLIHNIDPSTQTQPGMARIQCSRSVWATRTLVGPFTPYNQHSGRQLTGL